MPKVSVVTLPEDVLKAPSAGQPAAAAVEERQLGISFPWRELARELYNRITILFSPANILIDVLAFLLGRVCLIGEVAPFGLAFFAAVASVSRERAPMAGLWALLGVISVGQYMEAGIYFLSMIMYWRISDKLDRMLPKAHAVPLLIFGCVLLSGLPLSLWREVSFYNTMLVVLDAAMCMVLAFIFSFGMPLVVFSSEQKARGAEALICAVFILAIAVAGLGNATIMEYSVRNMAGGLITMALALTGGSGLGAAGGVAVGLVVSLSDGYATAAIAIYSLAGLLGGLFRSWGKPAVLLGFLLGSTIGTLYFGQAGELLLVLVESSLASAVFFALPAIRLSRWRESWLTDESGVDAEAALDAAINKLQNMAAMFNDLAKAFSNANTKEETAYQDKIKEAQLKEMLSCVGDKVCGACTRRDACWDRDFYQIYQAMLATLVLAEGDRLKGSSLPDYIKANCANQKELIEIIGRVADNNRVHWYWQKKMGECRQVGAEQMKATGEIIINLASEIKRGPQNDREVAGMLSERAAALDCPLSAVQVAWKRGTVTVDAQKLPCGGTKECVHTILPLAANLLQEKMVLHTSCGNKEKNKKCKLTLELAEKYFVETGRATAAKGGDSGVCADVCARLDLGKGKVALILSDGMGSGQEAVGESQATVSFLQKLLTMGFDVDTAVMTVNSLLLLKTPESYATLDMVIVDTYTGETEFLKIGAPPSFVKRVREVSTIKSSGLPIGIIQHIEITPVKRALSRGDIIVMVSDGIIDAARGKENEFERENEKESWVANFLRRLATERPQEIANRILHQAEEFSQGTAEDDMAVLVIRIAELPPLIQ
ncbi:MAG TPA: stage II sporulation protein E [Methylomusa anaerophila]|uniref:Stage II sporulation protein E n=1 Tax=Methylomusa anaerophila TaxID=1930071 RepID=A0A348AJK5_9FIRM|nr:stage II sporulation protein E [Methylomusa anaerophila]BBB91253.1 stage II sporulation protein E [Methylomusa anaerophila]HML89753.1 stage II sporulation protein E [Methylomusa anaerophila]